MKKFLSYAVALALLIIVCFPILRIASNIAGYNLVSFKVYVLSLAALCAFGFLLLPSNVKRA